MEKIEKFCLPNSDGNKKKLQGTDKKWAILSLSSIPLVMTLGNSMLIPVLPSIEKELSISSVQSSMIITVYSIVAIILIPIAGYISDHIGRKKVIIPSLLIAGIGGLISGYAAWKMNDPYWTILIGRALQGVGAAGAAPIVMPLVGDMFKDENEVSSTLGIIETSNTLGKVLSPVLGAFLAGFIWFIPFFSFPIFCVFSVVLIALLVKCPPSDDKPLPVKKFFRKLKDILKKDGHWLYSIFLIGCILMFVLFGILFYLSDIFEKQYSIKGVKKGLFLALPLGALCLSSFITGKVIKKNKVLMKWLIFFGILLSCLSIAALYFSTQLWFMITMFLISGIGIGIGLPSLDALITEGIEKEERGTVSSLYSSMRFIGVAAGPPIVAFLIEKQELWIFILMSGLCIIAALLSLIEIKPDKKG